MKTLQESILSGRKQSIEKDINRANREVIMRELIETMIEAIDAISGKPNANRVPVKFKRVINNCLEKLEMKDYVADVERLGMDGYVSIYIHRSDKYDSIMDLKHDELHTLNGSIHDIYWLLVYDQEDGAYEELKDTISKALDMTPDEYTRYKYCKFGIHKL